MYSTNSQVRSFIEVVRCGSFSKAANHLYISQSGVSKNIASLENRVGFILIDRSENRVKPTRIGEMFYEFYLEQEKKYKELTDRANAIIKGQTGEIRLGSLNGWDISRIYRNLKESLRENHPGIDLSISGYDYPFILEALENKQIDIGIVLDLFLPKHNSFISKVIADVPIIMVCSSEHPCTADKDLSIEDFKDEPFYVISPDKQHDNPMGAMVTDMCAAYGFVPRLVYEPSYVSIYMQLQKGYGVWITSGWVSIEQSSLYRTIRLNKEMKVCAVWRDEDEKDGLKHVLVSELTRR